MSWKFNVWQACGLAMLLSALTLRAQPSPIPTTGDAPCAAEPSGAVLKDTLASVPNDSGYFSLFDGTFKGWWQSCLTNHSSGDREKGAAFRIGSDGGKPAIYSSQHSQDGSATGVRNGVGGILMTHKIFGNYELVFDFWPDYGNDGGIFNRTTAQGACFQTVLDYISAGSVGGTWGEGGYATRDIRPWSYNSESSISIPAGPTGWTGITAVNNPTSYGCLPTGCVEADYLRLWDNNGWNQIRIQFYGGSVPGTGTVHMKSWFRKVGAATWVPIIADTTLNKLTPPGYIGLQVHSGSRSNGLKGTWYKNIMWRPMDDQGNVIKPMVSKVPGLSQAAKSSFNFSYTPFKLVGYSDKNFRMTIQDANGKILEEFHGRPGKIDHAFRNGAQGWITIQVVSGSRMEAGRIYVPSSALTH